MATALTYKQRNAMAAKSAGALQPVPAIKIDPYTPFLAALEASMVGHFGTPQDGFDALFNPLIAALPNHAVQIAAMDKDITAASFTPGEIVKTIYAPIGVNITALAKQGDAALATLLSGKVTSGSGGGGTGGGGSSGGGGGAPPRGVTACDGFGGYGPGGGGTDPTGPTIDIRNAVLKNRCVDIGADLASGPVHVTKADLQRMKEQ